MCAQIISLGWFNHANCGDEAFKDALPLVFPGHAWVYLNNISRNLDLINSRDYMIIGGGNIVDAGFLRGLESVKIPYSFVGVGLVRGSDLALLRGSESVIVRDKNSLSIAPEGTQLAPDITFSFSPSLDRGKAILRGLPGIKPQRPTVGVFLNDCVSARFDSTLLKFIECEKVKLELSRFLENLSYNVVFIPMSFVPPDDRRISLDVIGKMHKGYRYHCVTERLTPRDCLDLASALDFAITMRLHADIFCTIAGVPFLDLVHHDKNKGYLASLDESTLSTDFYGLNLKVLQDKFDYLESNRDEISRRLMAKAAHNKKQLEVLRTNVHIPQGRPDKTGQ